MYPASGGALAPTIARDEAVRLRWQRWTRPLRWQLKSKEW